MNTQELIDNIEAGDAQTSNNTFNGIMASRMNAALDTMKQTVASSMYGVKETPATEEPISDTEV